MINPANWAKFGTARQRSVLADHVGTSSIGTRLLLECQAHAKPHGPTVSRKVGVATAQTGVAAQCIRCVSCYRDAMRFQHIGCSAVVRACIHVWHHANASRISSPSRIRSQAASKLPRQSRCRVEVHEQERPQHAYVNRPSNCLHIWICKPIGFVASSAAIQC